MRARLYAQGVLLASLEFEPPVGKLPAAAACVTLVLDEPGVERRSGSRDPLFLHGLLEPMSR